MKKNVIDPEVLNTLPNLPVEEARQVAIDIIMNDNYKSDQIVKERLVRDLNATPTSDKICAIMYRIYLAGAGMRTVNSTWKNQF